MSKLVSYTKIERAFQELRNSLDVIMELSQDINPDTHAAEMDLYLTTETSFRDMESRLYKAVSDSADTVTA